MAEAWVVNASPIILYARIGRLDLLENLAPKIHVPSSVMEEVGMGIGKDFSVSTAIEWMRKYQADDIIVPSSVEHWDIGSGESQVISHCLQGRRLAVLDDRMARRCASAHQIPVIGSMGIVLRAKANGVIALAKPMFDQLRNAGMYADGGLVRQVLASVGE